MAFAESGLTLQYIGGPGGRKIWHYVTTDSIGTVLGASYFNAPNSNLQAGDVIEAILVDSVSNPTSATARHRLLITSVSAGVATVTDDQTIQGDLTLAGGGLVAANGFAARPTLCHSGGIPAYVSTFGTQVTPVTTEVYLAEVFVPCNMSITGIAVFNGATVGTDKYCVVLYDSAGNAVANSDTDGVTTAGADDYQRIPFTAAYAAKGPATYYIGLTVNGTTDRFNAHGLGDFPAGKVTGEVFGTISASLTMPTTFTADLGPVASLY